MKPSTAFLCVLLVAGPALWGCSAPNRGNSIKDADRFKVSVRGLSGVRYWVDTDTESLAVAGLAARERERRDRAKRGLKGDLGPAYFLAVSGGGDKGAFAAGLLNGWSAAGGRPEFNLVTGVSTGALIAPFAFLGREYDHVLKDVYTRLGPRHIYESRSMLAAITNDAMADNKPLLKEIRRRITPELLRAIARQYQRGRMLLVGTVALDLQRPVVWDMGAIATSKDPDARELFCRILLASAAIPGVFPPTMIDVTLDSKRFQEMHVDGGVAAQVFLYPASKAFKDKLDTGIKRPVRALYVIRNARLDPEWAHVERRTTSIAVRAIDTLIHNQGLTNLVHLYNLAKRDELDYNLAFIGPDFKVVHKVNFETAYMRALFEYGFDMARSGRMWHKQPPGI